MNIKNILLAFPVMAFSLVGCLQEEPLESEADILQCKLSGDKEYLITKADTLMEVTSIMNNITIFVKQGCNLTKRAPEFVLTKGATISPKSGSVQDFSDNKEVIYTVTSESGEWKRIYHVTYRCAVSLPTHFSFENYMLNESNKYHIIYEVVDGVDILSWWNTGNPGFCLASSVGPEGYPTVVVEDGYKGKAIKMTTRFAGSFGKAAGMPIAPGNLFLGTFNVQQALKSPLSATRFGVPFLQEPDSIVGWYKYKPGPKMTDGSYREIDGTDDFNIYAILYENTDKDGNAVMLDGTNSLNSEHLVLLAQMPASDRKNTDKWLRFSFPFKAMNGKKVDKDRLQKYGYNFGIVFSSSLKGDDFTGAVGSELYVDEVEIVCKETAK
ncbi:MAG: PCMD domain-containing protein [Paludibacteraceae bacterium]|nr:PCMD domain-containing protein [Paludibacteraceae bacterium]